VSFEHFQNYLTSSPELLHLYTASFLRSEATLEAETFFRVLEVASTSAEDVVEIPCPDSRIAREQPTLKSWLYAISQ
jgi:hypothetical protein